MSEAVKKPCMDLVLQAHHSRPFPQIAGIPVAPLRFLQEIAAVSEAVVKQGMNLVVFGEWFNLDSMSQMKFYDDNTRSWWTPATGGSG